MELGGSPEDRAVSTLIGAVFLVGVLVILLSVYQAVVVPQQNKKVEFDHSMAVQDDMLDLRNAILEARSTGDTTFAEVKLGTDYPPRTFALNPPAASGAVRTSEPHRVGIRDSSGTVSGVCPGGDPVETRHLTHRIDYNQYQDPPTIVYENTVLYLNFSGQNILLTNETLVEGSTFNVSPMTGDVDEQGVTAESIEPVPGPETTESVTDAEIEIPSHLSVDTWETLLAEDIDDGTVADVRETGNGNITIEAADATEISVSCSPISLNGPPPSGIREESGSESDINPVGPDDVELRSFTFDGSSDTITAEFVNTAPRDTNATEGRAAFFYDATQPQGGGNVPSEVDVEEDSPGAATSATLEFLGPTEQFDPKIAFAGNDSSTFVRFRFDANVQNKDFLVVQITFSSGQRGTYFINTGG